MYELAELELGARSIDLQYRAKRCNHTESGRSA